MMTDEGTVRIEGKRDPDNPGQFRVKIVQADPRCRISLELLALVEAGKYPHMSTDGTTLTMWDDEGNRYTYELGGIDDRGHARWMVQVFGAQCVRGSW